LLSGKIRAVHRAINPGIYLSDSDNLERIAVNAATAVGRKVKSSFMEGLGKRKIVEVDRALLSAFYCWLFQRIIDKSNRCINPDDRDWYVKQVIANDHEFRRDGMIYVEYSIRVRSYAEQEPFERDHFDSRIVDTYWRQGAGINVVVCGYATQLSVLIELRDVAYLRLYMKTSPDAFVSDRIGFLNNVRSATTLAGPFVEQLSLFDGCRFGTLEILWKYYRSITNSNQRRHQVIQSQLATAQATTGTALATMCVSKGSTPDTDVPFFDNTSVHLELSDENIETFVSVVETAYKNSFKRQYIGFSVIGNSLVEMKHLRGMHVCRVFVILFRAGCNSREWIT